jgi:hypothetical protein
MLHEIEMCIKLSHLNQRVSLISCLYLVLCCQIIGSSGTEKQCQFRLSIIGFADDSQTERRHIPRSPIICLAPLVWLVLGH